ncbi:MAG: DNA repair protein RecN [Actinomycetota bacterium]|nr:DNA repair protein RecN [Actinomycetota bacterium]
MLSELVVDSLGVIDHAEVSFEPGSSAITGETGAGKTLVVAAVGLLLGGRADRVLVREGATAARVEGRFLVAPDHPALGVLERAGIPFEAGPEGVELILSRTVPASGASSARLNGILVTAALLAEVGPTLAEIAGHQEHARVAGSSWQRRLLDSFAGPTTVALARQVASSWSATLEARRRLDSLVETERARERELDVVRFEIKEIEAAAVVPGELAHLSVEVGRLAGAEALGTGLASSSEALEGERGAGELLAFAGSQVAGLTASDPELKELVDRIESTRIEVTDIAAELRARIVAPDPGALAAAQERLAVLSRLRRKYGETEEEILLYLERARARRDELDKAAEDVHKLEREVVELENMAMAAATELSAARKRAAAELQAAVERRLSELAMGGSRFEVAVTERSLYEGGLETVELLLAANEGESPRPLSKVASGGELSRVALALHLLASSEGASTLVFDEVDAGVGGEAAQSVGRALASLAHDNGQQVIVVTHLPQVAAFANAHYSVSKATSKSRTQAAIERVDADARVEELSRMLAGLPESERGREHARELLDMAARASAVA